MNTQVHSSLTPDRGGFEDLRDLLARPPLQAGINYGMVGGPRQTYVELSDAARRMAAGLIDEGVAPGDSVIVMVADPKDFLEAFWGCLLAGACPVPLGAGSTEDALSKLLRVAKVLGAPWLLSDGPLSDGIEGLAAKLDLTPQLEAMLWRWRTIANVARVYVPAQVQQQMEGIEVSPDDPAFIQFSSGSTGDPKGVVLTHARVLAHLEDLSTSCEATAADTFLSWFPLTHDMGMVLMHLVPLMLGAEQGQIATKSFVQRPRKWLARAAEIGATVLCTNNFGLKHFLKVTGGKRPPEDDLSHVRLMFNAAEPISAALWEDFMSFSQATGLPRRAMYPGYGLAEATLAVTVPEPGDGMRTWSVDRAALGPGDTIRAAQSVEDEVVLVDVGRALENTELRIADQNNTDLGDARVGEVQLRSRSAAQRYFKDDETAQLYTSDGWLRTGDLGVLRDGRLFITGRIKEVITQGGQNLYPHDIEQVAEQVPGVELGKVIVTSVFDPKAQSEQLLLFLHTRRIDAEFAALASAVRRKLASVGGWSVDVVIPITSVPKTSSGKIRRSHLGNSYLNGEFSDLQEQLEAVRASVVESQVRLARNQKARLRQILAALQRSAIAVLPEGTALNIRGPLVDQGMTSARAMAFSVEATTALGLEVPVVALYDHPTLLDLAGALAQETDTETTAQHVSTQPPVAVTGMACRFPGDVTSPEGFFAELIQGYCAVGPLPDSRAPRGLPRSARPVAGFLGEVDQFDAGFFGISWAEADAMDPQQRMLLMVCHEALERAGLTGDLLADRTVGTFIGMSNVDYADAMRAAPPSRYSYTGISPSIGAGRIAYALGLTGPAIAVDTACSSSLVALHNAVQSLLSGECDTAIVAGVNLILGPDGHARLTQMSALSPTGICSAFDEAADGYVRAEGCGAVVLRLEADAQRDGDNINARITGTAVNQDGRSGGMTVPSGPAQTSLIRQALARAGRTPADVDYVEAHGTGTPLGDPVELNALGRVFAADRENDNRLALGSVKSNIGHLEAAAGMAGLIKTIAALEAKRLPASLHCAQPSSRIDWTRQRLEVVTKTRPWPKRGDARVAGVSAFGFAGTNAHVILESAAPAEAQYREPKIELSPVITLSAADAGALAQLAGDLREYVLNTPGITPQTLAAGLARTHSSLPYRATAPLDKTEDIATALSQLATGTPSAFKTGQIKSDALSQIAFVFTGQGSQWAGMGAHLLSASTAFAETIDTIDRVLEAEAGWTVRDTLTCDASDSLLKRTDRAQVAIFAVQVGLCQLLETLGILPDAVVGHSVGEIAAHHVAGILSLEDATRLAARRGALMQQATGRGRMLAVALSEEEVMGWIETRTIDLAAINGPRSVVLSGAPEDISEQSAALKAAGVRCTDLGVDYAFHGRYVADEADALPKHLADLSFNEATLPLYSTVTGGAISAVDAAYWRENVGKPVRFASAVEAMGAAGCTDFIEIGAHPALKTALDDCFGEIEPRNRPALFGTLRKDKPAGSTLANLLGQLHTRGISPDWAHLYPNRFVLRGLPTYPWQTRSFWLKEYKPWDALVQQAGGAEGTLYAEVESAISLPPATIERSPLLVICTPESRHIAEAFLETTSAECTLHVLARDTQPTAIGPTHQAVILTHRPDVDARNAPELLEATASAIRLATELNCSTTWAATFEQTAPDCVEALLRVAAREHPELGLKRARLTAMRDLEGFSALLRSDQSALASDEWRIAGTTAKTVQVEQVQSPEKGRELQVRSDASYLITGGMGNLGLHFAKMLADLGAGKVVLLGRSAPGPEAADIIETLKRDGTQVEIVPCDVTDRTAMRSILSGHFAAQQPLRGVIHCSGVLADGTVQFLKAADFEKAHHAKVFGAHVLDEILGDHPLDFMLLMSSAAVTLGSPGQGAYAAANGALDALARARTAAGKPTLSLQLGIVAGTAMTKGDAVVVRDLSRVGVDALSPQTLGDGLNDAWATDSPVLTLMSFDADLWTQYLRDPFNRSRFASLCTEGASDTSEDKVQPTVSNVSALRELTTTARRDTLIGELRKLIEEIEQTPADQLDPDTPLQDLGINSLSILELRTAVEQRYGLSIAIAQYFEHSTIRAFAGYMSGLLAPDTPETSSKPPRVNATAPNDVRAALRAKLEKYR